SLFNSTRLPPVGTARDHTNPQAVLCTWRLSIGRDGVRKGIQLAGRGPLRTREDLMNLVDKKIIFPVASLCLALGVATLVAQSYKPKHVNRALELLADGQPIYYTGSHSGRTGTFEQGVKDAQTFADYISYDMEHAPFDVKGLSEYMKGLVKGGPTKSGHRTPAVIVNVN